MKKDIREIIRRPLITERASELQEDHNKFVFEVRVDANKLEIKKAAETLFDVRVLSVNTSSVAGKLKRMGRFQGRRAAWKKAIVTLASGDTIDFFGES
ncbi:MAG: 50S ribosomal protein L23 [Gemmatimonadota bacterium]|nr:50S ribosomal protein L23 [Gemmatimonadota bacterium]